MRALSLWQPWASAVALGAKRVETRSWSTSYRGPIAIHAAKRWTKSERATWAAWRLTWPDFFRAELVTPPLGVVVVVAELVDCVPTESLKASGGLGEMEEAMGDYASGRYGWVLVRRRPIRPLPMRGMQGLWTLTADQEAAVLVRQAEAKREAEEAF